MPGPDPVCSSRTPQLPPELDSQLPIGVPVEHPSHAAQTTVEVVAELAGEGIGELAPRLGRGRAPVVRRRRCGLRRQRRHDALRGRAPTVRLARRRDAAGCRTRPSVAGGRARALGYAAGLAGMSDREIGALRDRLPAGLRTWFQDGAAQQLEDERAEPDCAADARAELQRMTRAYSEGMAAAIGGWNDPARGDAFAIGRERMAAYMESHPCEAEGLRAQYRGDFRAGFQAADRGPVDAGRYERDAAYRVGVEHERALERAGDRSALEAERARIGGVSPRDLAGARIAG